VRQHHDGTSTDTLEVSTVKPTFPPPEPGRHGWADLLRLVGDVRRLAFAYLSRWMARCAGSVTGSE
jgi:hypothetical protein